MSTERVLVDGTVRDRPAYSRAFTDGVCAHARGDRLPRASAGRHRRRPGEATKERAAEHTARCSPQRSRLRIAWAARAASVTTAAASARELIVHATSRDEDFSRARVPLEVSTLDAELTSGTTLYLRTPHGLFATEVRETGGTAEGLGVRSLAVHACTRVGLAGAVRSDIRLERITMSLRADDDQHLHTLASALDAGRTEILECVLLQVFDEIVTSVLRASTDFARRLASGDCNRLAPGAEPIGMTTATSSPADQPNPPATDSKNTKST